MTSPAPANTAAASTIQTIKANANVAGSNEYSFIAENTVK